MAFIKEKDKDYFKKAKSIQNIRKTISNDSNWESTKTADIFLSPFKYITGFSEMHSATSGMVFGVWIWLYALVNNSKIINEET